MVRDSTCVAVRPTSHLNCAMNELLFKHEFRISINAKYKFSYEKRGKITKIFSKRISGKPKRRNISSLMKIVKSVFKTFSKGITPEKLEQK